MKVFHQWTAGKIPSTLVTGRFSIKKLSFCRNFLRTPLRWPVVTGLFSRIKHYLMKDKWNKLNWIKRIFNHRVNKILFCVHYLHLFWHFCDTKNKLSEYWVLQLNSKLSFFWPNNGHKNVVLMFWSNKMWYFFFSWSIRWARILRNHQNSHGFHKDQTQTWG